LRTSKPEATLTSGTDYGYNLALDIPTAAVEAGVGQSTIRRWLAAGHLAPITRRPVTVWSHDVNQLRDELRSKRLAALDKARPV
jgi:hypothetical protein